MTISKAAAGLARRLSSARSLAASVCVVALLCAASVTGAAWIAGPAWAQASAPPEESPEDYPAGAGRDDTFYACTACHGFKLIAQQGMNRRQWDEAIALMVSKHGMPEPDAKDRETILNYLEATFPPRAPASRGGFQNPFAR